VKVREVIKLIEADGWTFHRQRDPEQHLPASRIARWVVAIWTVIYERGPNSWGAYVPALPGLGVAGKTRAEVEKLIREGIAFHLEGLAEDGLPIPDPNSIEVDTVEVDAIAV
jgi:predicted RNase H-like HicB family nuclease